MGRGSQGIVAEAVSLALARGPEMPSILLEGIYLHSMSTKDIVPRYGEDYVTRLSL